MIERLIVDYLKVQPAIDGYCGDCVFVISAPESAAKPYITVAASDSAESSDVVSVFDVYVRIYDQGDDKEAVQDISRHIKKLLHGETLDDDPAGDYCRVRLWLEERGYVRHPDPETEPPHLLMRFSARAIERLTNN